MHVCHVITKPELGGAQLSTLNILSNLPRNEYEISVITSPKGILSSEFRGLRATKVYFSPFLTGSINPLLDILAFIHIYSIYRNNKYAIVHTHSSKGGIIGRWAARLAGVRVIIHTVHGWSFNDYQGPLRRRLFLFLEKITATFTTKIICVSKKDIATGLKYRIAPRDKFSLIKYGIPLAEFKKAPLDPLQKKREIGITNRDPVVGMISCLKEQKSPLDYIKAAIKIYEEMPNVNFLLVGDGVLRTRCRKLLDRSPLNGRFIFTGWRRDISEILDILDVVVLTSKWEGMPISIIEALSKGRIVVATNTGGVSELIEDALTGYLTHPGSYKEITEKVLEIFRAPGSFNKMKKRASLSIDDSFGVGRMVGEIAALYKDLA
jgi:glycosyltransferase involved in cell wall biosynthesis